MREGLMQPILRLVIAGFIAGFLAVLIFHQSVWYLLYQIGMIPPKRPAWPLERALGDLQSLLGRSVGVRRWRRSSAD